MHYDGLRAPTGDPVWVVADGDAIVRIAPALTESQLGEDLARRFDSQAVRAPGHALLREALRQLQQYFRGERRRFELPVRLQGTAFQREVWRALEDIPYGETRSYGEVARAIGRPRAARAVGAANGANPVAIVVPCHRVIESGGGLGGYGGGRRLKQFLLDLERRVSAAPPLGPTAR
ncbi:MAG: methylated-DNA--[protein]-cysteine S-methyltransferase [Bryobacteraceae bacterium]